MIARRLITLDRVKKRLSCPARIVRATIIQLHFWTNMVKISVYEVAQSERLAPLDQLSFLPFFLSAKPLTTKCHLLCLISSLILKYRLVIRDQFHLLIRFRRFDRRSVNLHRE